MQKIWFKAKRYGWGWYPASWEGWLTLFVYLLLLFCGMNLYVPLLQYAPDASTTLWFAFFCWMITLVLFYVCYRHGEDPRWRWGEKKKSIRKKKTGA